MSMEDKINHLKRECAELRRENVDLREHLTIMYVDKENQKVKLEKKIEELEAEISYAKTYW